MNPRTFALTFLALLGLLVAPVSGAIGVGAPEFDEDDDRYVLHDAHVTVTFENKTTRLHVAPTEGAASDAEANYTLTLRSIAEHRDVDDDGLPSHAEALTRLDLEGATDWNVSSHKVGDAVIVNFTLVAPVTPATAPADLHAIVQRDAEVTLLFTLGGATGGLATELVVVRWPWLDAQAHRLVLDAHIDRELALDASQGGAAIVANETPIGFLSWAPNATGVDANGEAFDVAVRAYAEADENVTRLALVYDAPGVRSLAHDARFGLPVQERVDETADVPNLFNEVPSVGALAAVGTLAAVAFVNRRRA